MLRVALKSVLARKFRLLLTVVAIAVSVAFVAGTLVLTDTLNSTFDRLFGNVYDKTDVSVQGTTAVAGRGGQADEHAEVSEATLAAVVAVPGVRKAVGRHQGIATLVDPATGKAIVNGQAPTLAVGVPDPELSTLTVVDGRMPATPTEMAVDRATARLHHLAVGETVQVVTTGATDVHAVVTGIVTSGAQDSLAGATLVVFSPDAIARYVSQPHSFTELAVLAAPGTSPDQLRARIASVLPADNVALTGKEASARAAGDLKRRLSFLSTALLIFAGVSLFVATFLIVNTFTMLVAQRAKELALLRAIGARRSQVTAAVVVEAVVVGLAAGVLGVGFGIGVGALLQLLLNAGASLPTGPLVIAPRAFGVPILLAVVVTVIAALAPAVRASRVPPVAAMRDDFVLPARSLRARVGLGVGCAVVGAVALGLGLSGDGPTLVGLGVGLLFVGVALLAPVLSGPIVRVVAAPFARSTLGRIARQNALRNPRRTASTASALMIGLALVSTVGVFATSTVASIDKLVDRSISADVVVSTQAQQGFSPAVAARLRAVPGVRDVTEVRFGRARIGADAVSIVGATAATGFNAFNLTLVRGDAGALAKGQLLIDEKAADTRHLAIGQPVELLWQAGGRQTITVGGVYETNQFAGQYTVGLDSFDRFSTARTDALATVNLVPGADVPAVRSALDAIAKDVPTITVADQTEFKKQARDQIGQALAIIDGLLALAIIIAALGILNTLALSVIERTREIGLMRAIGTTRPQLRRLIRIEAVIVALFGAVLGVVLGTGFGIALVHALKSQGIDSLALPWTTMGACFVLAGVIGVVAAILPARRAARMDVLKAIAAV
jgi:putative ABC transport system permease protein